MWLDNLKELKKQKGLSSKQIADMANLPERTVVRIFSGDTPNPYADTLQRIAAALDASLDDILGNSKAIVSNKSIATMQTEVEALTAEVERLTTENTLLREKAETLSAAYDIVKMKLEHKDEIIALHNRYSSLLGIERTKRTKKPENQKRKKTTTP